jgi:hypothetical protein
MFNIRLFMLASAGFLVSFTSQAQYANSVVSYSSGTGFGSGLTDPTQALGEPSRVTPGMFGGPVDPFDPPYLSSQVVSVGTGGSLILQFNSPIVNNPGHPFGMDFIIFGNSGFIITNGNYSGGGITDGSTFGNNTGVTKVSVSDDGVHFYTLNPAFAPTVDSLFPTDGSGNFQQPVNPALTGSSFAGLGLTGIQSLYNGSGGGTAFSLSWALDSNSQSIFLPSVSYVRIDVLGGASEIDGIAAVPEPTTLSLALASAGILILRRHRKH